MPMYDYRCTSCDHQLTDVMVKIADRDRATTEPCPACGKLTVERCFAAPGVSYTINNGGLKTPDGFKDILRDIKSKHRRSTINV